MKLNSRVSLVNLLNHLAESAPKMLRKGEPEFDFTLISFWLSKELAARFWSALNELRLELVPWHARDTDILNAFWDELVCEVSANPQMYLERPEVLDDLINRFGDCWKKPLSEFEVTYSIDYLSLGREPITLLGVEFFAPTDEALAQRGIPKLEVARWSKREGASTLAVARIEAVSSSMAFEAGRGQVVDAITLMKASALLGLAGRTLTDELLQWKLSSHYLARTVTAGEPSECWLWGYHRQFGPLVDDLGNYLRQGIEGLRLELLRDLPENIRERIVRSMYWITHSSTHEADDHKFVDLCTALEILLLPEEQFVTNKGTIISLRYNLLGGDLNPSAVKWMYNRRNDVIHGSPLPVVGPQDTWHLRLVCYTTIRLIVGASADRPDVLTLQDLLGVVETAERLATLVERAEKGIYKGLLLPDLVKEAEKRLKRLTRRYRQDEYLSISAQLPRQRGSDDPHVCWRSSVAAPMELRFLQIGGVEAS